MQSWDSYMAEKNGEIGDFMFISGKNKKNLNNPRRYDFMWGILLDREREIERERN